MFLLNIPYSMVLHITRANILLVRVLHYLPAISVHQYMASANDVNNTESQ